MRIVTLNCFLSPWCPGRKERLPLIARALAEDGADIVLLQEIPSRRDVAYITEALSKVGFVDHFHSRSLCIVSRHPLRSRFHRDFRLRPSANLVLYWNEMVNWLYGKGFQCVEIETGGRPLAIANTHLISAFGRDYDPYRAARTRQLREIVDHLWDYRDVVLSGDFNFTAKSRSYELPVEYGYRDPLAKVEGVTVSTVENLNRRFFLMDKCHHRVDHFFVRGIPSTELSGNVVFNTPCMANNKPFHISDHYGLALNITP